MLYFTAHQHDFLSTHEPKLPQPARLRAARRRHPGHPALPARLLPLPGKRRGEPGQRCAQETRIAHRPRTGIPITMLPGPNRPPATPGLPVVLHESWAAVEHRNRYDYMPDFVWSNTVHQASAACANYFLWNEFLTGGNNDVARRRLCRPRTITRAPLACSLAALNRHPLASAGMWGMPQTHRRAHAGRQPGVMARWVTPGSARYKTMPRAAWKCCSSTRKTWFSVDERFGSWMSLYGLCQLHQRRESCWKYWQRHGGWATGGERRALPYRLRVV